MLGLETEAGMRVGELVKIRTNNIDINNKRIMIVGKGDRSRFQNFSQKYDKKMWNSIMDKYIKDARFLFYRTRFEFYPSKIKT